MDLLDIAPIEGVTVIKGDFTDTGIQNRILDQFENRKLDLVLSDMAPNISGIRVTDQANAERLQLAIRDFCLRGLNHGGKMLTKIFEGENTGQVKTLFNENFEQLKTIKPDASKSRSREIYLLGMGFK